MKRRDFIRVIGMGGAMISLPVIASPSKPAPLKAGHDQTPESDIRLILLSYAVLAPNAHNIQPWLIKLEPNLNFKLYVDQERLLPETDPFARQIHISQGTFIENLHLAAQANGYELIINYFPDGMYDSENIPTKQAIAHFRLKKTQNATATPLYAQIKERQSNKRIYESKPIAKQVLNKLKRIDLEPNISLFISNDAALIKPIPEKLTEAMAIEVSDHARDLETIKQFRFNDEERMRFRDGFSVEQTGKTGFQKWLVETFFISREKALSHQSDFGQQSVQLTKEQAESATAFGWIVSQNNTRLDQVLAGRVYERVCLNCQQLGLAQHPMSQVLEEYPQMTKARENFRRHLNVEADQTLQMFFRLGYADEVPHTLRRPIQDMLS